MDDCIIEPAKIEDYESISELYNELHKVLEECNPQKFRKIEKNETIFSKEYFERALNHEINTNIDVYKSNGKILGIIEYAVWDAYQNTGFIPCTVCVIGNIVVKKEYQNQGIGTQLFEHIKNVKCPEYEAQRIELDMEAKNGQALSFYKKLGLVEDKIRFSINVTSC